jgi:hypothetical protein
MPHYSHDPAITDPAPPSASGGVGPLPGQIGRCDPPPADPAPPADPPPTVEQPDDLSYPDPHLPE